MVSKNFMITVLQHDAVEHAKRCHEDFKRYYWINRDKLNFIYMIDVISDENWERLFNIIYNVKDVEGLRKYLAEYALVLEDSKEEK